jgi:hypothetical protein
LNIYSRFAVAGPNGGILAIVVTNTQGDIVLLENNYMYKNKLKK